MVETLDVSRVISEANKELIEVARRSDASVLRQRFYDGLSSNDWMAQVMSEIKRRCPMVFKFLSGLLEFEVNPQKKTPAICLIYAIMMFIRCHELSRIQRINSVLLLQGQASTNVSLLKTFATV